MPRKTKDSSSEEEKKVTKKKATKSTKQTDSKKVATKKTTKSSTTAKKATTKKSTTSTKKSTTKKVASKKAEPKKTTATKKTTTKKKTTISKKVTKNKYINEYYDLPYRYNQTIVRILAQTPKMLFVYWDISDADRKNFEDSYGQNFFYTTKPVLIVHNKTLNYSFEVDINDFANSWYLHVNDANCEYNIELGRRPIPFAENSTHIPEYIYISSSNDLEAPNNKVLFNPPIYETVYFRNVKTNQIIAKSIFDFPFIANIKNIGEFYSVYDLYKKLYKGEDLNFINNPSSGATSSMFSSQFK